MWKQWWLLLLLNFVNFFFLITSPLAHGVRGLPYRGEALGVEAFYSDGTPMAYAKVKIYFDKEKIPFQTGVTDRNGRFLFAPDRKGTYQIIINDGEGHLLEMKISTKKVIFSSSRPHSTITQTLLD